MIPICCPTKWPLISQLSHLLPELLGKVKHTSQVQLSQCYNIYNTTYNIIQQSSVVFYVYSFGTMSAFCLFSPSPAISSWSFEIGFIHSESSGPSTFLYIVSPQLIFSEWMMELKCWLAYASFSQIEESLMPHYKSRLSSLQGHWSTSA